MKNTHPNSIDAYKSFDKDTRYKLIVDTLEKSDSPMTDRQITYSLGFSERNAVSPRITELIQKGLLEEAGNTFDHTTGVRVRTVRVKERRLF